MRSAQGLRGFISRLVPGILAVAVLVGLVGCGGSSPTIQPPPPPSISVAITSHPAGINAGLSYQFVANVMHATNTAVSWSLACSSACSGAAIGVVSPDGTYSAPAAVPQPVDLVVTATSAADTTKSASAQFRLMPAVQISMGPAPAQVVLGFVHHFTADIQNDLNNRGVQWFVGDVAGGNATLGTIDSQGVYSAPTGSSEMIISIVAKSVTDPTKTDSATVTLIVNTHPDFTGAYTFSFKGPDGLALTAAAGTIQLDGAGRLSATLDINSGSANTFSAGRGCDWFLWIRARQPGARDVDL